MILNRCVLSIMILLKRKYLYIKTFLVRGTLNVIADGLSRQTPLPSEWLQDRSSFLWVKKQALEAPIRPVCHAGGPSTPTLCITDDGQATATDAFVDNWNKWNCIFHFPLSPQFLKVLTKITSHHGRAILVAPFWPNQPGYLPLMNRPFKYFMIPKPILSQGVGHKTSYASSNL